MSGRIGLIAYALAVFAVICGCAPPSDQVLIERFHANKPKFEELLGMVQEDSEVRRIAPDFLIPAGSLTDDRWEEYRALFDELGIVDGVAKWKPSGPIEFTVSSRGFVTGGDSKGYAYSESSPDLLYDSLNSRPVDSESNVPVYRTIDDGWYLYYSWDD